jgi:hypothetical protein
MQYCARPDLHDLFSFAWSQNPSYQEFADSPLHQEFNCVRRQLRLTHEQLQLTVGDFVQIKNDPNRFHRIDAMSFELDASSNPNPNPNLNLGSEAKAKPSAASQTLLGPEDLQLGLKCTPFIIARHWRKYFESSTPPGTTDTDLIEAKGPAAHQISPCDVLRKVRVLSNDQRPPNEIRRPNWTYYCRYVFNSETSVFSEYVPVLPVLTPPEAHNGKLKFVCRYLNCSLIDQLA